MTKADQTLKNGPKQSFTSAYYEKRQKQLVLLIIMESTKMFFAEAPGQLGRFY